MQSFFGDAKPVKRALVSTVAVKKTVVRPPGGASSASSPHPTPSSTTASSSLPKKPKSALAPLASSSRPSPSSVSVPPKHRPTPPSRHSPSSPTGGSPAPRKRKPIAGPQRVLPFRDSDSESSDENEDIAGLGDGVRKRHRGATTSAATPDATADSVGRTVFCPQLVDERGEWGRGWAGFVPSDEAVRGVLRGWAGGTAGAREVTLTAGVAGTSNGAGLEKYQAYFPQPGFENAEPLPTVELFYPAPGCRERFVLLTPASGREYNPMSELRNALRMILKHYVPPSHAHIFGTLSDSINDIESSLPSRVHTPTPGSLATPPPDVSSPGAGQSGSSAPTGANSAFTPAPGTPGTPHETIGDALRKALAPNRRDGPGLLRAMDRLNTALEGIQADGTLAAWLANPDRIIARRDWSNLVDFVHDQAYSRVVGPFSDQLEHHPKHSDEVAAAITEKEDAYGELRHNFMSKIIEQTNLNPDSVFVDLGSGVGNCVVQASLQAGCRSYGFELLPVPARCARLQLRECQRRWAMWCLDGNLGAEVHEGDFRRHESVARRLAEADVVLVNNEVFPSSLNMDLTQLFLDLKEGAKIVSLKPFVPDGFRMNESNCDSFAAILRSAPHAYHPGWVSWKADSGRYYVQVIDRKMRMRYDEEKSRRKRG